MQKVSAQPLATHVSQLRQALDSVGRPMTPEQGRALDAALRPRPREVVAIYARRWSIEVLFKELRQDLGLADYQMLAEEGVLHHLHVCCPAQLLLTHRSLDALGAKAKDGHEQVTLPPMSTRLADLRAEVARDQIERLVKGGQHAHLRRKLCDYLLAP